MNSFGVIQVLLATVQSKSGVSLPHTSLPNHYLISSLPNVYFVTMSWIELKLIYSQKRFSFRSFTSTAVLIKLVPRDDTVLVVCTRRYELPCCLQQFAFCWKYAKILKLHGSNVKTWRIRIRIKEVKRRERRRTRRMT